MSHAPLYTINLDNGRPVFDPPARIEGYGQAVEKIRDVRAEGEKLLGEVKLPRMFIVPIRPDGSVDALRLCNVCDSAAAVPSDPCGYCPDCEADERAQREANAPSIQAQEEIAWMEREIEREAAALASEPDGGFPDEVPEDLDDPLDGRQEHPLS